jgi:hypothetical protein
MPDMTAPKDDPGLILDKKDPGDDIQLRFRYQHTFAAIQCLRLLEAEPTYDAVFCENHEDVLLRKTTGKYDGVQVKTRQLNGDSFRANEEPILKAIGRFAALEKEFSARFDTYHLVTNHRFWMEEDNDRNLHHIVRTIQKRGGIKGLPTANPLRLYIVGICNRSGCGESMVVGALLKTQLRAEESDLEHTYGDLMEAIAETRDYRSRSYLEVQLLADNLIYLVYEASSKKLGGQISELYDLVFDYTATREQLLLKGKTITAGRVDAMIVRSFADAAENLLVSSQSVPESLLPPGFDVMTEKLAHGGLQLERVNLLKDFKASFEAAYLRWCHKNSVRIANDRLEHIKTMVLDDCVEAKIASENSELPYASAMYQELRKRFLSRVQKPTLPLFGCAEEHLLGAAGILTEECRVWWSEHFPLRNAGQM